MGEPCAQGGSRDCRPCRITRLADREVERKSSWLDLLTDRSRGRATIVDDQGETGTTPTHQIHPLAVRIHSKAHELAVVEVMAMGRRLGRAWRGQG